MAESPSLDAGLLLKGSVCPVTIEEALPHMVVVALEHGATIFRGILMDSTNRDMSYGLGFNHLRCGNETPRPENHGGVINAGLPPGPCITSPVAAEVSALSLRQSYSHGPDSTDQKLIPPPRTVVPAKPARLRDKSVRKMRLRPRQILCTKCKQGIHENKVGSRHSERVVNASKNNSAAAAVQVALSQREWRAQQRKRRIREINSDMKSEPLPAPKKMQKPNWVSHLRPKSAVSPKPVSQPEPTVKPDPASKLCPVIKISFSSPKGEGTVVKIPHKSHSEIKTLPEPETTYSRDEYRRIKKAMKKARKERPSADSSPSRHHKKSKRSKHRVKKKHKHKENNPESIPAIRDPEFPCISDVEDNTITSSNVGGYVHKDLETREDSEWALTPPEFVQEDILDAGNSLKENSQNTPYQAKLTRTFLRNADGSSFELSNRSNTNSSGNSDRSSVYDDNSNSDFNEEDEDLSDPLQHVADQEEKNEVKFHPLMMRIQTKNVSQCQIPDGRTINVGDVVWGKIHGFPWWPGKVISINVSQRDNGVIIAHKAHIAWFGSSTRSHIPCDELFPFLEDFKLRFNKKKRGAYKLAIKQATLSAEDVPTVEPTAAKDLEDIDMDFED